uniref:RING-type domain-containing protein n=1 Tax=Opuntia streptacantha TaxID=393608 RepID=A0A7C9ASD0_OPUST
MTDVQPLQQKPESAADAQADFECGLEEFMRGHLDDCMSFASCSSPRTTEDDDEEGDQLVRRRRRSDLEGDDLAESSAARRRHSRILSRWAARQAQEMITTMERRNRESELMALAGLHPVSMLDYSFLRESQSPTSRRQGNVERPSTRASAILQMWRELEDEHLLNRARERVRERLRHERSVDTNTDVSTVTMSESRTGENQGSLEDVSESENDFGAWSHEQMETQNEHGGHNHSSREQSPDLGDVERERVRQIVRGWMDSGINERSSNATRRADSPRAEWLGETERERVRLVREWVQMASQQRGTRGGRREDQLTGLGARDRVRDGLVDREEGQPEQVRRDMLRLRGRQALIDLLVRIERERQRELQGLLEHRAVSDFAHRNRIQSLLRGRFLRTERPVEDERPASVAAGELLQLRQRHTVSGLREGFRSRLETIVRGQASNNSDDDPRNEQAVLQTAAEVQVQNSEQVQPQSRANGVNELPDNSINASIEASADSVTREETAIQGGGWQEQVTENERRNLPQSNFAELDQWREVPGENLAGDWQGNSDNHWREMAHGNDGAEEGHIHGRQVWHVDGSRATLENWTEAPADPPRMRRGIPLRRGNRFHPPDDDNVYSMELRELVSRRSVSTLLRSGFRESLDQLIQSYVERQGRAPIAWDLHRNLPSPAAGQRDQESQQEEQNIGDAMPGRPVLPTPPVPPPQPIWQQDLHHTNWPRHGMHRSELEWEMMNDLRADVARLQQGMNHMQRMLEACMDMQLELQRSVRQEVSAALNRSSDGQVAETSEDGSRWGHVRKGTCCVCCDSHIDSLLYRCGHMCTCLKCANELVRGGGKCPLCRAPIVEVIRAYSIL